MPGRRRGKSGPLREAPPPLEGDERLVTLALTGAWLAALIVVALLRHHLPDPQRWIWICVAGVGLGLFGLAYVPRVKRSRARAAARRSEARRSGDQGGVVP